MISEHRKDFNMRSLLAAIVGRSSPSFFAHESCSQGLVLSVVHADAMFSAMMYQNVPNVFCSRTFHRWGSMGCVSSIEGDLGTLLPISTTVREHPVFLPDGMVGGVIVELIARRVRPI